MLVAFQVVFYGKNLIFVYSGTATVSYWFTVGWDLTGKRKARAGRAVVMLQMLGQGGLVLKYCLPLPF